MPLLVNARPLGSATDLVDRRQPRLHSERRAKANRFSPGDAHRAGAQIACPTVPLSVNSPHGRSRNAAIAESFSATSPGPAAPAKPAHSSGAVARTAQSRATGD